MHPEIRNIGMVDIERNITSRTAVSIPKHDNPAVVASVAGDETYRELMDDSIIHEGVKV